MAYQEDDIFVMAMGEDFYDMVIKGTTPTLKDLAFINTHHDGNSYHGYKDKYENKLHKSMRFYVDLRVYGGCNYRGYGHITLHKFLIKNCHIYIELNKTFKKLFGNPINGNYFEFRDLYKYTRRVFPSKFSVDAAFAVEKKVKKKVGRRTGPPKRGMQTPPSSDDEGDGDVDITT